MKAATSRISHATKVARTAEVHAPGTQPACSGQKMHQTPSILMRILRITARLKSNPGQWPLFAVLIGGFLGGCGHVRACGLGPRAG